jgi:hypothetical protein
MGDKRTGKKKKKLRPAVKEETSNLNLQVPINTQKTKKPSAK